MGKLFQNANRRVSFECFWQGGCSHSKRCNAHGSCVAAAQSKSTKDVTREYRIAVAAAERFNPGEQPDIAKLMRSAFVHGYAQALIDSQSDAAVKPA